MSQISFLWGDPIPVVDASNEILEEEPEDIVIANEPDKVEEPEVAQGLEEPEDILADAAVRNDDDFILDFNQAEEEAELAQIVMDPQQLQAYIGDLQNEITEFRNDQNRIEVANDLQDSSPKYWKSG